MRPDPFYRRSGFWAAAIASVPLAFAAFKGTVTPELVVATLGAWGAFFTAQRVRPSNSNRDVRALLEQQAEHIKNLEIVNDCEG